jgi:hypothetical protein
MVVSAFVTVLFFFDPGISRVNASRGGVVPA